jgi:hypothetical protein
MNKYKVLCPKCKSDKVCVATYKTTNLISHKNRCHCFECDYIFKGNKLIVEFDNC